MNKQDFLEAKAQNFVKYISGYKPSDKIQHFIESFSKEEIIPTITGKLIPLVSVGATDTVVADLLLELEVPPEDKETVGAKIKAYILMFVEVIKS